MVSFKNFNNNAIISNIKIIKSGGTVNPDPFAASVIFHAPMNGSVADRTGNVGVTPSGDLTYTTGPFDGTSGYVYNSRTDDKYLTYGPLPIDGDFTLEYWGLIPSTAASVSRHLVYGNYGLEDGFAFQNLNSATLDVALTNASSTSINVVGQGTFTRDVWNFVTLIREGTTFRYYINGVLINSLVSSKTFNTAFGLRVGALDLNSASYELGSTAFRGEGYMYDLRITEAIRYTGNFTPPTEPFPT
ncbi:MAG: LamG-like jellyroll fold domain-containing protein [Candidimonas sp.]